MDGARAGGGHQATPQERTQSSNDPMETEEGEEPPETYMAQGRAADRSNGAASGPDREEPEGLSSSLPPEMQAAPPGEPSVELQRKIATWIHIQETQGRSVTEEIRKSRCLR